MVYRHGKTLEKSENLAQTIRMSDFYQGTRQKQTKYLINQFKFVSETGAGCNWMSHGVPVDTLGYVGCVG